MTVMKYHDQNCKWLPAFLQVSFVLLVLGELGPPHTPYGASSEFLGEEH
jgi:hypothetical protein